MADVHHLVYHWVEESWYRELIQKCHSARAYVLILMRQLNAQVKISSNWVQT